MRATCRHAALVSTHLLRGSSELEKNVYVSRTLAYRGQSCNSAVDLDLSAILQCLVAPGFRLCRAPDLGYTLCNYSLGRRVQEGLYILV